MADKTRLKVYVDRIEDGVATIALYDDDEVHFNLPARLLPESTKEGDYFQLSFRKDQESRAAEKKKADDLLKELLARNQEGQESGKES